MRPQTDRTARAAALIAALLCLAAGPAAASVRVDDSGTIVSTPVAPMRWRQLVPGRGSDNTVEAQVRVAVRLNMAPWLNRQVRLYMGLPASGAGPVIQATWRTQGRLLAGSLRSGTRALVFEGRVTAPVLEETIDLYLSTDGRLLTQTQDLPFFFEVDNP